jgi:asparagine N-glycosylation enzyme membrane subunit Stt3
MILEGQNLPYSADYLTGHLIAMVSELSGTSIEWVMFLLPIFIAPLIAIPIIMIASSIKQSTLGFLAALFAVSETYFYTRSFLGYMDTDGMNLFLILLSIAFIVKAISQKSIFYAVLASFALQFFSMWYHSSSVINLLIVGTTLSIILFFYRKDTLSFQIVFLLVIAIAPIPVELKFLGTLVLSSMFILINRYTVISYKTYWYILALGIVFATLFVDPSYYLHRALNYLSPENQIHFSGNGINYSYANDLLTVSEVRGSHLWNTSAPLSITKMYVIVGIIGYLLLLVAYPLMWFTLPLFILGLMSSFAGARFSMYATPVVALGMSYVLYLLKQFFTNKYKESVYAKRLPFYATALILLMMVYNLLIMNMSAMLKASIYAPEAKELKKFSKILKNDDMMISWWDYGWPLWYYTGNNNTLVDNGKHGGPDTYIVARMMLSTNQHYTYNAAKIMGENRFKANKNNNEFVVQYLAKEHNLSSLFSSKLAENEIQMEENYGNIYIVLHYKMLDFFGVINDFSKKSLSGGTLGNSPMVKITEIMKPFSETYSLFKGFAYILDSSDGTVVDSTSNKTPVKGLTIVQNNTRTKGYLFNQDKNITNTQVIAYRNKFIWVDQEIYDSFFIQAMLFDEYDHTLFEKVGETNRIKIFKLKKKSE